MSSSPTESNQYVPRRTSTVQSDDSNSAHRPTSFHLSGVLNEVKEIVHGHPFRHHTEPKRILSPIGLEPGKSSHEFEDLRGRSRTRKGTIDRIGEVLGIERGAAQSEPDWKEFQAGWFLNTNTLRSLSLMF